MAYFVKIGAIPGNWSGVGSRGFHSSPTRVAVVNNGTGPAIIRSIVLTVDGTAVNADDVVAAAKRLDIPGPYDSYTPAPGDTLRATESIDLLTLSKCPEDLAQRKELRRKLHRIEFHITYESIYGERFDLPGRVRPDRPLQPSSGAPAGS